MRSICRGASAERSIKALHEFFMLPRDAYSVLIKDVHPFAASDAINIDCMHPASCMASYRRADFAIPHSANPCWHLRALH